MSRINGGTQTIDDLPIPPLADIERLHVESFRHLLAEENRNTGFQLEENGFRLASLRIDHRFSPAHHDRLSERRRRLLAEENDIPGMRHICGIDRGAATHTARHRSVTHRGANPRVTPTP